MIYFGRLRNCEKVYFSFRITHYLKPAEHCRFKGSKEVGMSVGTQILSLTSLIIKKLQGFENGRKPKFVHFLGKLSTLASIFSNTGGNHTENFFPQLEYIFKIGKLLLKSSPQISGTKPYF